MTGVVIKGGCTGGGAAGGGGRIVVFDPDLDEIKTIGSSFASLSRYDRHSQPRAKQLVRLPFGVSL